ncbi:hypothetical protein GAH_00080 [Geoglobus ahangari]|uniref:Uncharacterized protein n=1 Tax=Geoglobus ahangari TaxID=113653 RepID=A0A0F7IHU0_9EURY|nr:hypothetical protein GAH_00080 [Geoglobus ahangari]
MDDDELLDYYFELNMRREVCRREQLNKRFVEAKLKRSRE